LDRITKNDAIKPDSEVGYIFMWRNSIFWTIWSFL
jgi:hypothetical protein